MVIRHNKKAPPYELQSYTVNAMRNDGKGTLHEHTQQTYSTFKITENQNREIGNRVQETLMTNHLKFGRKIL